jgi:hypothetical protein
MEKRKMIYITLVIVVVLTISSVFIFMNYKNSGYVVNESQAEKVTIKAYLNLGGCGEEVINLLDGLVQEYKEQVSVEYIDFGTREGYNRMIKDGLNCQGLVINGKQTYTIKDSNGKQREVTFSHPINTQYTADDLKIVVKLLLGENKG